MSRLFLNKVPEKFSVKRTRACPTYSPKDTSGMPILNTKRMPLNKPSMGLTYCQWAITRDQQKSKSAKTIFCFYPKSAEPYGRHRERN